MPNLVFLGVPDPTNRIPVLRTLRECYGFGLQASKKIVMGEEPPPHELPTLPDRLTEEAHEKLTLAGALLEPLNMDPPEEVEPRDFLARLDEDLF